MSSKIVPLLPKHTVYVEPFAGSAAIMFAKPRPDVSNVANYVEVLNDINGDVVNFFRQLRDYPDDLVRVCSLTPYSREEYCTAKQRFESLDALERARRLFISAMQSFGKKLDAGWGFGVATRNHAATWSSTCARLYACAERLQSVYIEHDDVLKVIARWDSPQTLFYCDPPYPGTQQGHYKGYTQEQFQALVSKLDSCQGSFVLSCYEQPGMPEHWEHFEFAAHCAASGKGRVGKGRNKTRAATQEELGDKKRTEVVWRVIRGQNVRPELRKLYEQGNFDCFAEPPIDWYAK
jgi:DNA adenine methylase